MTPEFSRSEPVDTIGAQHRSVTIAADAAECAALATRFALLAIDRLDATLLLWRDAGGIGVRGTVAAEVTQACSITGDPLPVRVTAPIDLRFVDPAPAAEEVELSDHAIDTIEIEDDAIDLGEAAAETIALALDPFPRGPNAAAALKAAGVLSEDEVRPVSAFAGLKDRLEKR